MAIASEKCYSFYCTFFYYMYTGMRHHVIEKNFIEMHCIIGFAQRIFKCSPRFAGEPFGLKFYLFFNARHATCHYL